MSGHNIYIPKSLESSFDWDLHFITVFKTVHEHGHFSVLVNMLPHPVALFLLRIWKLWVSGASVCKCIQWDTVTQLCGPKHVLIIRSRWPREWIIRGGLFYYFFVIWVDLKLLAWSFFMQGFIQQQSQGNGATGAQLLQLQPAATDGAAGRTEQLCGGLPKHTVSSSLSQTHVLDWFHCCFCPVWLGEQQIPGTDWNTQISLMKTTVALVMH